MEHGVRNADVFIAIVTDNGVDSYFSRDMCRDEIAWAIDSGKRIVPVVAVADKHRISEFIAEGRLYGIDFSEYNFCQYDRSGPEYSKASVRAICLQADLDTDDLPQTPKSPKLTGGRLTQSPKQRSTTPKQAGGRWPHSPKQASWRFSV